MRQREPRKKDRKYLGIIKRLPCVVTGSQGGCDAAHVRYGSPVYFKRQTGMQEKPDDYWAIPLSPEKHRLHNDAQHNGSEVAFWRQHHIDPLEVCTALLAAYQEHHPDRYVGSTMRAEEEMENVIFRYTMFR